MEGDEDEDSQSVLAGLFSGGEFKASLNSYSLPINRERRGRSTGSHTVKSCDTFWIRQQVLEWINNWLHNRKQWVGGDPALLEKKSHLRDFAESALYSIIISGLEKEISGEKTNCADEVFQGSKDKGRLKNCKRAF